MAYPNLNIFLRLAMAYLFETKYPKQQREGSIFTISLKEERKKDMKAISTLCAV